jgi:NAD(P)-dependent dehydrogenase (short-subunit alcohol dehydrogenase family)
MLKDATASILELHSSLADGVGMRCAGAFGTSALSECEESFVDSMLSANVKSVIFGLKHSMQAMRQSGSGGSIVVTSSGMSSTAKSSTAGVGLYSASKAAADMLVRYAAIEGAPHGMSLVDCGTRTLILCQACRIHVAVLNQSEFWLPSVPQTADLQGRAWKISHK